MTICMLLRNIVNYYVDNCMNVLFLFILASNHQDSVKIAYFIVYCLSNKLRKIYSTQIFTDRLIKSQTVIY